MERKIVGDTVGIKNQKEPGLYFIDSLGRVAPDMLINKMMIVRSGKRNMPDECWQRSDAD